MHSYHGSHGDSGEDRVDRGGRESMLDTIGWAAFFIWVGTAWLLGVEFGVMLIGIGVVALLVQGARRVFRVNVEGFWVLLGCGFFAAGYWELWDVGIPIAPVLMIVAGVGLLAWQVFRRGRRP
jgi:hypothetical protein